MTPYKLMQQPAYNPYIIGNKAAKSITFYDDNGEIATTQSGWMGSNHIHCEEMHALEFTRRLKVNLKLKEHFFVPSKDKFGDTVVALYVYVPKSELIVQQVGEHLSREDENERVYSQFFEITGTFDPQYDWSKPEYKTLRFSYGQPRYEMTERGEMLNKLKALIGGDYEAGKKAEQIIKNKTEVLAILSEVAA